MSEHKTGSFAKFLEGQNINVAVKSLNKQVENWDAKEDSFDNEDVDCGGLFGDDDDY